MSRDTRENPTTICLIGGGATGTVVLHQLVEELAANPPHHHVDILIIEKNGAVGPGLAYSTPSNSHILNMSAGTMSAKPGYPDDFVNWANLNKTQWCTSYASEEIRPTDFPPRWVYGKYLDHLVKQSMELAVRCNIKVEVVADEVTGLSEVNNRLSIELQNRRSFLCDYAVLCLGNQASTFAEELEGYSGYFHSSWPASNFTSAIPSDEPVVILGSGLTAIDTLFSLLDQQHCGQVTFVSRTGLLPKVQAPAAKHTPTFLTVENLLLGKHPLCLRQVMELFKQEILSVEGENFDFEAEIHPNGTALEIMRRDLSRAKQARGIRYQAVLYATADYIGKIWNLLPPHEQHLFDVAYSSLWKVFRHPTPIVNAERIIGALEEGQLQVFGGVKCVIPSSDKSHFIVNLDTNHARNDLRTSEIHTRYVINATGQTFNLNKLSNPLIQSMMKKRLLASHPSGGIAVDYYTGRVINATGKKMNHVYAIGPLTRGVHFYTNALSENVKCAAQTVHDLLKQIDVASNDLTNDMQPQIVTP